MDKYDHRFGPCSATNCASFASSSTDHEPLTTFFAVDMRETTRAWIWGCATGPGFGIEAEEEEEGDTSDWNGGSFVPAEADAGLGAVMIGLLL